MKMPKKPTGPSKIEQWMRDVVDCLERLQPTPGNNTFVDVTTRGTMRSAKPGGGGRTTSTAGPARYA